MTGSVRGHFEHGGITTLLRCGVGNSRMLMKNYHISCPAYFHIPASVSLVLLLFILCAVGDALQPQQALEGKKHPRDESALLLQSLHGDVDRWMVPFR